MRTYLDCYPCFLRQALSAARQVGANDEQQHAILGEALALLQTLPSGATPPEIGYAVHRIVRERMEGGDPYRALKDQSTRAALALYPRLKALVAASPDPLETAVRLSIAGNIIDFALSDELADLWATVERVLAAPFAVDDLGVLRAALDAADRVLFLADNAGETVFDRVLIETLDLPVIYVVKGGPTLNDATREDALAAGLETCATVIDNGSDAPGTILRLCSEDFRRVYAAAPLIIAKGQGNYETLSEAGPRVFCLLQVKCPVIARDIGAPVGSVVMRQSYSPL
ncbi:MAG TPA: ARMT1-like domain-containing protein [Anaerolineae bacterium]|nr:ARMT1-like domain-containing protein [Anaerolineae bacterium]HQI86364.1 ARMT1-like domain-containing protein [Anaerolineae bacterium]